jgi:hypothetical protein
MLVGELRLVRFDYRPAFPSGSIVRQESTLVKRKSRGQAGRGQAGPVRGRKQQAVSPQPHPLDQLDHLVMPGLSVPYVSRHLYCRR